MDKETKRNFGRGEKRAPSVRFYPLDDKADREVSNGRPPTFDVASIKELKQEWLVQVRKLATERNLLAYPDLGSILFRWKDYAENSSEMKDWLCQATASDSGFATVVTGLMLTGSKHSFEDMVSSRFNTFNKANIDMVFGLDDALRRVHSLDRSTLSPEHINAVDLLKQHLESWSSGQELL